MNPKHRVRRRPLRLPGVLPGRAWLALCLFTVQAAMAQAQAPGQVRAPVPPVAAASARQAPVYDVSRLGLGTSLPIAPGVAASAAAPGLAASAAAAGMAATAPSVAVIAVPAASDAAAAGATGAAAPAVDAPLGADLQTQIRQMVASGTKGIVAPGSGITRVDVDVGVLDPRLRLAPCAKVEPFLPNGMRLAGRSRIGLRCLEGTTRWSVYLPITVRIFGPALVAAQPLQAGAVLTEADLRTQEIDLADDPSPAMTQLQAVVGRTLARPMSAGQGLRQATLKSRQWFAVGDTVSIDAVGDGFAVAGEGQALTPGVEGQPARVKTESGRIVTGMPVSSRRLEVRL